MNNNNSIHPKMYMYRRIVEAKSYIDKHYCEKIDLEDISNQAAFSKYHFLRLFKKAFGMSPHKYLTQVRLKHAKNLLLAGCPIADVCYQVGFESIPSFTALFKSETGLSPMAFILEMQKSDRIMAEKPAAFIPGCFAKSMGVE